MSPKWPLLPEKYPSRFQHGWLGSPGVLGQAVLTSAVGRYHLPRHLHGVRERFRSLPLPAIHPDPRQAWPFTSVSRFVMSED